MASPAELLNLVNRIENGLNSIGDKHPESRADVAVVTTVIASLREQLELPTLADQDRAIGGALAAIVGTTANPDDRQQLENVRAELELAGIKTDPPPN